MTREVEVDGRADRDGPRRRARRRRGCERLRARFPEADAVVFGHSHIPLHEERDGFQIFNPGSPTDRRRQPRHTMGVAEVADGVVTSAAPRRGLSSFGLRAVVGAASLTAQ